MTPPASAGLIALLVFGAAAWRTAPSLLQGDEPHYLVITQSLLLDRDLNIENNHRRGHYRAYHAGELPPHGHRRGPTSEIYSIHSPGLPAIVLPAFAIGGYHAVVMFLILLSAAGTALAWWVGWLATGRTDAAWFGWASVTLPVTAVFHSFTVYPDGPGGLLALTGVWALLRADTERQTGSHKVLPWFWHGVALAILPWLHSRFAILAGGLGALVLLRLSTTRNPAAKAVAFLSVPAVSALLWLGFFMAVYGRPDPSAPYSAGELGSLLWVPGGLAGLLFDQRFGLLPYAPVLAFAFAGLAVMLVRPASRRLSLELLFVIVPYLITATTFAMWWGGSSAPARFFVPVLPMLAVPAAACWVAVDRRRVRTLVLAALVFTVMATAAVVAVNRGRLAFNVRETPARWLEWLSGPANLPQALPWWTRGADGAFFRDTAIWIAALLMAALVLRVAPTRNAARERTALRTALAWALAIAVMGASTGVWALRRIDGRNTSSSQLELLQAVAFRPHAIGIDVEKARRLEPSAIPGRLRIEFTRPLTPGRASGRDALLFDVPRVPAGEYRVTPIADRPGGWLMFGIGRDQFAVRTEPVLSSPQPILLRFPVTVRGIVVRGDEDARQSVRELVVEPLAVITGGPVEWRTAIGWRAVRYGSATVFFVDDRSFPQPEGFWVGGARWSTLVIQPDDRRTSIEMRMRNGPSANRVTIDAAGKRTDLDFGPGEERQVSVPVEPSRGAGLVTVSVTGGFRPSEQDSNSRDDRFLGVWVRLE